MRNRRGHQPAGAASVRRARRGTPSLATWGVVAVVIFAAVLGFLLYRAQQARTEAWIPPGATAEGVMLGQPDAPVTVDVYLDFQCPVCARYEQEAGPVLAQLAESGRAKVVYHPVAYLDRFSSTRYSSRSSAAAGCVAGAGGSSYSRFQQLLFAQQPPEGAAGLTDDRLAALAAQAGAGGEAAECIAAERFAGWTAALTDAASRSGVTGTPTVLVNGRQVANSAQALRQAVADAH